MSPDLSSLLTSEQVSFDPVATSRKQLICDMAGSLAAALDLDARDVFEAVMERERLGTTGVGHGVAIPHARIPGLQRTAGAFARLSNGVDFEAVDDAPCDLVFLLLAPESAGADHLRALAKVSRVLRREDIRTALRSARSHDGLCNVLGVPLDPKIIAA